MKNYLIAFIALIGLALVLQGVSAQQTGWNNSCPGISTTVTLSDDEPDPNVPGSQIDPEQAPCLQVKKCGLDSSVCSCHNCGCNLYENGQPAPQGSGTHCMATGGVVKCPYVPTSCTNMGNGCDYSADGKWVGDNKGGYEYDEDDGYKMGLKEVTVNVTVTSAVGIRIVCKNGPNGGGIVTATVDNYDIQNGMSPRQAIVLMDPIECSTDPTATQATWTGKFKMHYWEKPGVYTVNVQTTTCCKNTSTLKTTFEYTEKEALCVAPPYKVIAYPPKTCFDSDATVEGDVETSTCGQCDIGSAASTIRNIGNAVTNVNVYGTDLKCSDPNVCGYDKVPVGRDMYNPGNIYINFGNGWKTLWNSTTKENLAAQTYCTKEVMQGCCNKTNVSIYGLPPGPHATNNMSLMIKPIPCVLPGYYTQTITITPDATEGCCQDHREVAWPVDTTCITTSPGGTGTLLPQCYETVTGKRYSVGTTCT